jgi:hypothetical protein
MTFKTGTAFMAKGDTAVYLSLVFAWLMVHRQYAYALLLLIPSVYFLLMIFSLLKKAQVEVDEFVQAIQYRDFSRNFNISQRLPNYNHCAKDSMISTLHLKPSARKKKNNISILKNS